MSWTILPSRRQLLAGLGAAPVASWPALAATVPDRAPIADIEGPVVAWLGDDPTLAHSRLWTGDAALADVALPPAREAEVVVVGGGVSGLAAAWRLRDHAPVLVEAQARFGGNARGERWGGIAASLGAAYFAWAPPRSRLHEAFYGPLGLAAAWRLSEGGGFVWDGALGDDLWRRGVDPSSRAAFSAVARFLRRTSRNAYPDMPPGEWQVLSDEALAVLDRRSLAEEITRGTGAPLHPHVRVFLELYCRSAFGGSVDEISAAAGLNFLCAELEPIAVLPGGNAGVAQAMFQDLPADSLVAETTVLRVQPRDGRGVEVVARGPDGFLVWSARAVVLACPKFVAARLCPTMPAGQRQAIGRLRYRPYTVANVWCRGRPAVETYDLYLMREPLGEPGAGPTDLVMGHFACPPSSSRSVVTFYRPLPTDGARAEIFDPSTVERFTAEAHAAAVDVLPLLGLTGDDIEDVRLARFGHALPLAETGLVADGTLAAARAPLPGVWFCHQDDWALPALETCLVRALEVEVDVRTALARG